MEQNPDLDAELKKHWQHVYEQLVGRVQAFRLLASRADTAISWELVRETLQDLRPDIPVLLNSQGDCSTCPHASLVLGLGMILLESARAPAQLILKNDPETLTLTVGRLRDVYLEAFINGCARSENAGSLGLFYYVQSLADLEKVKCHYDPLTEGVLLSLQPLGQ